MSRITLTAATTLYIAPATGAVPAGWANGNNSNSGATQLMPFATRQAAWDYAQTQLDLAGQSLTFQFCAGTYTDDFYGTGTLLGGTRWNVMFLGDISTPASVVINASSSGFSASEGAAFSLDGLKLVAAGGVCIGATDGGIIAYNRIDFGQSNGTHIWAGFGGKVIGGGYPYTISGGAQNHFKTDAWGQILVNPCAISMPNSCGFTVFCEMGTGYGCYKNLTFTGTGAGSGSTGNQAVVDEGATCLVGGAGYNYFPGYPGASSVTVDASTYSVYV